MRGASNSPVTNKWCTRVMSKVDTWKNNWNLNRWTDMRMMNAEIDKGYGTGENKKKRIKWSMKPFDLTIKWANRGPIIWWWKVMLMKIIWLLIGVKCLHWVVEKQGCMASGLSVRFKSKQQESKLLWVYINHHLRAIKFRAEFTFVIFDDNGRILQQEATEDSRSSFKT